MSAVVLPADLQAWAEAEVALGRAESVERIAALALADYRQRWEALRKSLDDAEAEANEKGWLDADAVFDEIEAELDADIRAEDEREALAARRA